MGAMSLVKVGLLTATCGGAALTRNNDESVSAARASRETRQRMRNLLITLSHCTTLSFRGYCQVTGRLYGLNTSCRGGVSPPLQRGRRNGRPDNTFKRRQPWRCAS